ncbi:CoA-binding protein, partial [Candidatus Bathyarchaeota archaeon]|nr:CoA-binding protein [Candidatus Bathyarchaeota archaeon]
MVVLHLDKIFNPKSIAITDVSNENTSIGYITLKNLIDSGFEGDIYPLSSNEKEILGRKAYNSIKDIPKNVDLAIITAPAAAVPEIVEECGQSGIKGIIIMSKGFKDSSAEDKKLRNRLLEIKRKYALRILGPSSLGVMRPSLKLNATLIPKMPKPGKIAFITQSAALGSASLDWAIHENIGFSNFVSIGAMIDVDFADLIDYFGTDPETRSILMYMENVTDARKFMSAARHFARTKPIIVVKAGKFGRAKATGPHIGSFIVEDEIYNAVFKRAGIVRVEEIADLFNCAEVLEVQPLPEGPNLAIITNAKGPGIMAADFLIANGGKLAEFSQQTISFLEGILPNPENSRNPIDLMEDAGADRYGAVLEACLRDEKVNGVLIIYASQPLSNPVEIAKTIIDVCKREGYRNKTVLTSFIGYGLVEEANKLLNEKGIPTHPTPEQAVKTYLYMYQYKRN